MSAEKPEPEPEPGDVAVSKGLLNMGGLHPTIGVVWRTIAETDLPDGFLFNVRALLAGAPSAWAAASKAAGRPAQGTDKLGIAEVLEDPNGLAGLSLPPWTELQVAVLNAFQAEPNCHPFTCGRNSSPLSTEAKCPGVLIAESDGWRCPACDYRQGWCHNFMLDPATIQAAREARELVGEKSDVPSAWAAALSFAPEVFLLEVGEGEGMREVIGLPNGVTLGDCDLNGPGSMVSRAFAMKDGTWIVVSGERDSKWEATGQGSFSEAIRQVLEEANG